VSFTPPCPWGEKPSKPSGSLPGLCADCYKPGAGNRKDLCYDPSSEAAGIGLTAQYVMPICA